MIVGIDNISCINKMKGFSLIELLVTMAIGLFLLSGLATSFVSSKHASFDRNEQSKLEDNGDFALEIISRYVQHTGYSSGKKFLEPYFITNSTNITQDTCPKNSSTETNVVDTSIFPVTLNGTSDVLGVMYHGDGNVFRDCIGDSLPQDCRLDDTNSSLSTTRSSLIYNSFFVDTATHTLRCAGSRNARAQVIAEGVENIQFLYGLNSGSNSLNISKVVNASQISPAEWNNVVSVQVALLVRSVEPIKNIAEAVTYTLLDSNVTSPEDRYERRVFKTTIPIRNGL